MASTVYGYRNFQLDVSSVVKGRKYDSFVTCDHAVRTDSIPRTNILTMLSHMRQAATMNKAHLSSMHFLFSDKKRGFSNLQSDCYSE